MSKHAELQALKQEIMESLHCALPGEVVAYYTETGTADIQPTIKTRSGKALPLLRDVPVYMPISFDVSVGDVALVVFADMDIDGWIAAGEAAEAASDRKHSLSDGFAFVGFMNVGKFPVMAKIDLASATSSSIVVPNGSRHIIIATTQNGNGYWVGYVRSTGSSDVNFYTILGNTSSQSFSVTKTVSTRTITFTQEIARVVNVIDIVCYGKACSAA